MLLLGANVASTNRGVSALGVASLANLRMAFPEARLIAANSGLARNAQVEMPGGISEVETSWIRPSQSLRPRSGTRYLDLLRRCRPWVPGCVHRRLSSRTFEQLMAADVVLDISGGDSFAEIYGEQRFQGQAAVKELALAMKKPLVLLPQTFGPFTSDQAVRAARRIIRGSVLVASRDLHGAEQLEELAGSDIRPRLASCPDVAFTLEPAAVGPGELPALLLGGREGPIIGLNVSGWLHSGDADVHLSVDYREMISRVVQWAWSIPRSRVLLVPHVFGRRRSEARSGKSAGFYSSDLEACRLVEEAWRGRFGDRLGFVERPTSAAGLKYIIGRCDFFIGARMHSCIGAASQGVPTAVLAYSRKAGGVFGMIGAGSMVVDMRKLTAREAIERIKAVHDQRSQLRRELQARMPAVRAMVCDFFAKRLRDALIEVGTIKEPMTAVR